MKAKPGKEFTPDKAFLFKGIPVYFSDKGSGQAVVFLHGFLENKEIWKDFTDVFTATNRVVCIDLPGHGKTGCISYIHSMELMAEAVYFVIKKLRIKRCKLVGHSMGGYVALAFAEANPEMVLGLCLFHSTARADTEPKKKDRERAIEIVKNNPALFIKEAVPNLFHTTKQAPLKRLIAKTIAMALQTPKQGIIAALEGMKVRLERELIIRFAPYPVLFIIGKYDKVIPYEGLFEQASLPENGKTLIISCGHMGFYEVPDKTSFAIKDFLKA